MASSLTRLVPQMVGITTGFSGTSLPLQPLHVASSDFFTSCGLRVVWLLTWRQASTHSKRSRDPGKIYKSSQCTSKVKQWHFCLVPVARPDSRGRDKTRAQILEGYASLGRETQKHLRQVLCTCARGSRDKTAHLLPTLSPAKIRWENK